MKAKKHINPRATIFDWILERWKKCGRYFDEKATARVAMEPESITKNIVHPYRNAIIGG